MKRKKEEQKPANTPFDSAKTIEEIARLLSYSVEHTDIAYKKAEEFFGKEGQHLVQ